jgi:hypothetical protein
MFLCFFNLFRLFFTLDRFGQQADWYIAPGGMFFMFLRPIISTTPEVGFEVGFER